MYQHLSRILTAGLILSLVATIGSSGTAPAEAETPEAIRVATAKDQKPAPPDFLKVPIDELSPRLREIRELLENEGKALNELREQYAAATNDSDALRIQRMIHDLKRGTETGLLEIQLKHARLDGNEEAVVRLEETLKRLSSPVVIVAPEDRPAPRRDR